MDIQDLSYPRVVPSLVAAVPELHRALAEHLRDNDEILQRVFFGSDVVPFVLAAWKAGNTDVVNRCLTVLEAALTCPDERTRALVLTHFVYRMAPRDPETRPFVAAWPPALAEAAMSYGYPSHCVRGRTARVPAQTRGITRWPKVCAERSSWPGAT